MADVPPPPDGIEGFDAPPPPDGVEGFDAPPPPDGVEGLDAPPSTDGVVGSDALPSTPNEQGPDFSTQASPPDADVSSLPEEVAEFDSGLDLDPTDELDVPAVAEGAGTADLFAEEPPELQDSPPAAVKSKEEVTPQDGIPTEEPSSGSQSESAHANAPRRSRKPALLALALAVGVVAWALTQTGSDGDTEAGNSEVANFADEEAPATTTSELSAEVPSRRLLGRMRKSRQRRYLSRTKESRQRQLMKQILLRRPQPACQTLLLRPAQAMASALAQQSPSHGQVLISRRDS